MILQNDEIKMLICVSNFFKKGKSNFVMQKYQTLHYNVIMY